ncbi:alternate-type signal peptide domain-containing protein [Gordonia sp. (in: high G+C Gram-positive bacteria)]|uniref:alternate-type signal peptide domain-containing protein n=1 Tax=Gordonia sp. (in: high G+C Gram-positive bacteria) TaxID=84139 RepID=UPI0016A1A6A3|nr:alternate-type signal peptide domain-containing protein [Gordonia sp. (in: high G+C Gram-positive bacteria)]NLG47959.1 alternate-type signal peptide domain-containing protein [Gordonia sp. (in: high G+C Gram-positive bacteria)]
MNKATKGALAAAAAAAILAGGAGTMAAWNQSTTGTGGGTITAGSLNVTQQAGTGVWKWVEGKKAGDPVDFENDKIVPGDKFTYTAIYDVVLVGTNLTATLTPTVAGVSGDLAPFLLATPTNGEAVEVTQTGPYTVSTNVTFSTDAPASTMTQTGILSGASVVLAQK